MDGDWPVLVRPLPRYATPLEGCVCGGFLFLANPYNLGMMMASLLESEVFL